MLDKLNQPKGSTIGVLKDGRTIQEAFDDLGFRVTVSQSTSFAQAVSKVEAAGGGTVFIPEGTWSVPVGVSTTTSIRIEGCGDKSVLLQPALSTSNFIFEQLLNNPSDMVRISDVSFVTERAFSVSNTAIRLDMRAQLSGDQVANRNRYRGYISGVSIRGDLDRTKGISFGIGIDLISMGWLTMDNIHIVGSSGSANQYLSNGVGVLQRGDGKPVETILRGLRALTLEYAYLCPEYTEGLYLSDAQMVNCRWGVVVSPIDTYKIGTLGQSGCYHISIDQVHVNVSQGGVFLSGCKYCYVSNVMGIIDDHGVSSSVLGVHLRNGYSCNVSNVSLVSYNVAGTTGITRQGVMLNGVTDSFVNNVIAKVESAAYEKITEVLRFVNASSRNEAVGIKGTYASIGVRVDSGCGENSIDGYRFQNTDTPVQDSAGDLCRKNVATFHATTVPPASSQEVELRITPRGYLSRRPQGVSYTITTPTTTSFPIIVFYDRDASTSTEVVLRVKPGVIGNNLPTVTIGISLTFHD
ncbi:hypothetical protein FPAPBKPN_00047 [Klebsiella phage vB_KpnP_2146-HW]|uniref:Probable tail spike protein n=1 Tax=Klebsiella phage vB_KpnP_2146-HW TaxID=3038211 RepID=A0A9Y1YYL8_9CAUD|nr:hypothetical protein FPAPBKPN_00047 [Klebsiella phage vB_KpnP_2146-HW]